MVKILDGVAALKGHAGTELGVSDWITIEQDDVDAFARLTGDDQWIHVDPERAADSHFGGTIVHGLLTVAIGVGLSRSVYRMTGFGYGLNYGADRLRFPAPLPVGSRFRMRAHLREVTDVAGGGVHVVVVHTFEREDAAKPVCVIESIKRLYPSGDPGAEGGRT
jgi:acyl dehydratase